jgi:hypothetical protein
MERKKRKQYELG